jgi:sulfatase modifying factor 1
MSRIFISYSHDDYDYVRQLAAHLSPLEELDGAGVEVWHDERFEAGDEVPPEIQRQLASADVVIAVLSNGYLKSGWCTWEWKQARANGKRIVPVLLRSCLYQPRCGGVQVIPQEKKRTVPLAMMADPDAGWVQVVTAAAKHLGIDLGFGPPEVTAPGISWPLMLGATVGPWTLGSLLGEGGYGAVFAAEDAEGRACALKVYRPRPDRDEDARGRERFRHGAAVLRGLSAGGGHPGVVGFIDGPAESDGHLWYAMERVPGRNLDAAFTDLARLPLSDRLRFFESLVAAVRFAHLDAPGGPVYHRDLTPENVLVDMTTTPPRPVLIDFDLARDAESDSLTRTQALVGKINYVPPEQSEAWKGGPVYQWERPDSELRDLWALGMLLQFVACGKASLVPALRKVQRDHILSAESAELQAATDEALDRMLHVDPAKRPQGIVPFAAMVAGLHCASPPPEPGIATPRRIAAVGRPQQHAGGRMGQLLSSIVPVPGELDTQANARPSMVQVPAGRFLRDGRQVEITRPFLIGATPVTQAGYAAVTRQKPSHFAGTDRPVENVSWLDAVRFCNALSKASGLDESYVIKGETVTWKGFASPGYRLPTEAEWEYACRAGSTGERYGELEAIAWYEGNSGKGTPPVGQKLPNAWGLYDTLGNVWEWCWDLYGEYPQGAVSDPTGATGGGRRVMRGGSWSDSADGGRAAFRNAWHPTNRSSNVGFRVVLPVPGVGGRP